VLTARSGEFAVRRITRERLSSGGVSHETRKPSEHPISGPRIVKSVVVAFIT
jgi:hypothetical protein